ncbi:MAG: type II secretion system protein [Limisphaerales bacterium]
MNPREHAQGSEIDRPGFSVVAIGRSGRERGWSLIELIAVLALISALLVVVANNVFQRINEASRESDARSLRSLGEGLRSYVIRTRSIPNAAGLAVALGQELAVPAGKVRVSQSGYNRFFLYDPGLRVGTTTNSTVTFTQGNAGSLQPVSPRLVIVSSVVKNLPTLATNTTVFNELWACTNGIAPASWTGWSSFGEDVRVERVELRDLFSRVVLSNVDPTRAGRYLFTGTTQLTVASGQQVEAWFIRGTPLDLFFANGLRQGREFVGDDVSYIHEEGRWRRGLLYGRRPELSTFGELVDDFLAAGIGNRTPKFGASNQSVVDEFFTYLDIFGAWATGDPPLVQPFEVGGSTSKQQVPAFRNLNDSAARMNSFSYNLTQ